MDEDLIDHALNLSKAPFTEMRIEENVGEHILLVDGEVKETGVANSRGFSLRVIDGGAGFFFSNTVTKTEIRRGIAWATRMARRQKGGVLRSEQAPSCDRDIVRATFPDIDEKMAYLHSLDQLVDAHRRVFSYADEQTAKLYGNSEGSIIRSRHPRVYLHYLLTVTNSGMEQMHREFGNVDGWSSVAGWNVASHLLHDATFLQKLLARGEKPPARGDVILSPFITGLIAHESCGHPFEADRILGREAAQAGKSYATKDLLGKPFAHESVSVADDPTIPRTYGFYRYDDEGVCARRRVLIKNGTVSEFLHNRQTAAEFGCASNAAARASYGKEPIVRMANTFFMPGGFTFDEMVEDITDGVHMVTFMEWNIDDRRVNQNYVGEEAYLIKNGEIAGIAKHPKLEISTFEFYRKIDAAGTNLAFYPATCGKGDPMQGIEVTTGGVDLRLRDVRLA
jgi:TldD protein